MDHGVIEQVAAPADIYESPASPFVFGFVGESNSLSVTVRGGEASFGDVELGPADVPDGRAIAFFRPHDVVLADDGIVATVVLARPRNGVTRIEAMADGVEKPLEVDLDIDPAIGSKLGIRPTRLRYFAEPGR
jgi:sulfate transport system ATP-binding protein